tara:strand:- start:258 stop:569 length:312 start_codon:yes stop_codon:yes gene_type:complete
MAVTLTWYTGNYRYELSGKGFIDQVEARIKVVDGSKEDDTWYTNVFLPRPADDDMEDRYTFATQAKLLAAAKAVMGSVGVAAAEESATLVLQQKTHGTAIAPS